MTCNGNSRNDLHRVLLALMVMNDMPDAFIVMISNTCKQHALFHQTIYDIQSTVISTFNTGGYLELDLRDGLVEGLTLYTAKLKFQRGWRTRAVGTGEGPRTPSGAWK
jgi:hypothetical protein